MDSEKNEGLVEDLAEDLGISEANGDVGYDDEELGEMMEDAVQDSGRKGLDPDAILDTLVPESIDWRSTVRRFPGISVAGVALVGYLVGRTKGRVIITGLTAALSSAMMNQLSDVFEGDFFDF